MNPRRAVACFLSMSCNRRRCAEVTSLTVGREGLSRPTGVSRFQQHRQGAGDRRGQAIGPAAQAVALGVDAFLTGELSEQNVHVAQENGIAFFAAGHHATERFGVQALGEHLAARFNLEHRFFDQDIPV